MFLSERLEISTLNSSKDTTLKENAIDIMKTTIASFSFFSKGRSTCQLPYGTTSHDQCVLGLLGLFVINERFKSSFSFENASTKNYRLQLW